MMDLKKKLIVTFSSIALLAVFNVGVSIWDVIHWHHNSVMISEHFKVNILIKNIETSISQAYESTLSALAIAEEKAEKNFDAELLPVSGFFDEWISLTTSDEEKKQIEDARNTFKKIVADGKEIFSLINIGHFRKAYDLQNRLKEGPMDSFSDTINDIISKNHSDWLVDSARMENSEKKAKRILIINIGGTLSLITLMVIYLISDIFSPLERLKKAIDKVSSGNLNFRLSEARNDDFGGINTSFNKMVDSIKAHLNMEKKCIVPLRNDSLSAPHNSSQNARLVLHTMLYRLQSTIHQLGNYCSIKDGTDNVITQKNLITQINQLLIHIIRIAEIGSPLDLNLSETDIRMMIHQLIMRFQKEITTKKINFRIDISSEIDRVVFDVLKIRESLVKIIQYTIDSISEKNKRIQIGVRSLKIKKELLIYVSNNGVTGDNVNLMPEKKTQPSHLPPIALIESIAKEHGGKLVISQHSEKGHLTTYLYLPHR